VIPTRKWKYIEPNDPEHDDWSAKEIIMTEQEIIDEYFPTWKKLMKKVHKEHLISEDLCIDDWVVVHWASEVKDV
jgi:hypothetical protein